MVVSVRYLLRDHSRQTQPLPDAPELEGSNQGPTLPPNRRFRMVANPVDFEATWIRAGEDTNLPERSRRSLHTPCRSNAQGQHTGPASLRLTQRAVAGAFRVLLPFQSACSVAWAFGVAQDTLQTPERAFNGARGRLFVGGQRLWPQLSLLVETCGLTLSSRCSLGAMTFVVPHRPAHADVLNLLRHDPGWCFDARGAKRSPVPNLGGRVSVAFKWSAREVSLRGGGSQ